MMKFEFFFWYLVNHVGNTLFFREGPLRIGFFFYFIYLSFQQITITTAGGGAGGGVLVLSK